MGQLITKLRVRLEPTLVPYSLTSVLSVMAVRDVVTTPVKIDVITRPTRTQAMAKIRAINPLGDRSPYLRENEARNWYSTHKTEVRYR